MAEGFEWTDAHINARVIYTSRAGTQKFGVVTQVIQVGRSKMLNLKLDGDTRENFFVPEDMVTLVPDDVADTLGEKE